MRFSSALTLRCCLVCPAAVSLSQIGKFLPNATKEQQAYKEQRQTTMLQQTGQFTMLTQFTKLEDPIAAALAAHGERHFVGGGVSRVCAMAADRGNLACGSNLLWCFSDSTYPQGASVV